jgi:hypothetical protein
MAPVPLPPPQRVGEELVGLLDRQEAALVARGRVRVVALREASVGGLDLRLVGAARHAQRAVRVRDGLQAAHSDVAVRGLR